MLPLGNGQSNPTHGQNAPEVSVSEERDVPFQRAQAGNQAIRAVGDLRGSFTVRTAVEKDIPAGLSLENFRGALAIEVSIVPLHQIWFDFGSRVQCGQFTGSPRTLSRTGQHMGKWNAPEPPGKFACLQFAPCGQWNVRDAGVPPRTRPLGFAVSNEVELRQHI